MLQLRANLPVEFESEEGLTTDGQDTMLVLQALLEKYGFHDITVVRMKS